MFTSLSTFDERDAAKRQLQSALAGVLGELASDFKEATNLPPASLFLSRGTAGSNVFLNRGLNVPTASFEDSLKSSAEGACGVKRNTAFSGISPLTATSTLLQGFEANRSAALAGYPTLSTPPPTVGSLNSHNVVADSYRASLLKGILEQEKSRMLHKGHLRMLQQEKQQQQHHQELQQRNQQQDLFRALKDDAMHSSSLLALRSRFDTGTSSLPFPSFQQVQGHPVYPNFDRLIPPSERRTPTDQQPCARMVAEAIGSSLRAGQPYIDVTVLPGLKETGFVAHRNRGGVTESFPEKLHRMLKDAEEEGLTDITSFLPHGRAFCVHDVEAFVSKILPKYFKQSKWNSFSRQLNLYGFNRITSGPDTGAYYHELFLNGRTTLCLHMRRVGVPQQDLDRRKSKSKPSTVECVPNFYSMKPL